MVRRPPNPIKKIIRRLVGREGNVDSKHVKDALEYIEDYWTELVHEEPKDHGTIIGLPYPYVVPANDPKAKFTFKEQYYWDSYLTAVGLVGTKRQELAEGMLENLLHIFKRFHFIPNASRMYFMSHSQPPILTTYIRLIYDTGAKQPAWLKERMAIAEDEYHRVWTNEEHPFWHKVYRGLSRYYDIHVLHDLAEAESGWDMTPRFERKCLDYLPIDLNCLLYKYEIDFAWAADQLGDEAAAKEWAAKAAHRRGEINRLMWHKRKGFYFDYNFVKRQPGDVWSLAGFYPMWLGLASKEQAARMVKHLPKFEHSGGLATTTRPLIDMTIFGSLKTQWAFPNGWAPLNWIVIEGLRQYGYEEEAEKLARKWLYANLFWFERHGVFLEKYNVVRPHKPPVEGLYPGQTGFGWTNAIFVDLAKRYLGEEHHD
jgi:alpha,alpha-trehalase